MGNFNNMDKYVILIDAILVAEMLRRVNELC